MAIDIDKFVHDQLSVWPAVAAKYRALKSAGRSIGLSSIGAQTMRKTFAWRYYRDTGDIYYLQNLLNHASPSITYRYIGERPNVDVVLKKMT